MQRKLIVSIVAMTAMIGLVVAGCQPQEPDDSRPPPEEGLTFTIMWLEFEKQAYARGEPVTVLMKLTNDTQDLITVNQRFAVNEEAGVKAGLGEVYFIVYGPDQQALPFLARIRIFHPEWYHFTTLHPSQSAVWGAELTLFYDLTHKGEYAFQAVYRSEAMPEGVEAWVGTLESNILTLMIVDES